MFSLAQNAGVKRRTKVYSSSASIRASRTSLLTTSTNTSGGSSSTVTQDSYDRDSLKRKKRRRKRDPDLKIKPKSNDVFKYMVSEDSSAQPKVTIGVAPIATSQAITKALEQPRSRSRKVEQSTEQSMKPHSRPESVDVDIENHDHDSEPEDYYKGLSDSGISMGSASAISASPLLQSLTAVVEEPFSRPSSRHAMDLALMDPRFMNLPGSPPSTYIPPPAPMPPVPYDPYPQTYSYAGNLTPPPTGDPVTPAIVPGIEIREAGDEEARPRYFRSFSKVSTRLLLHLQDDLADLEQEIEDLDLATDEIVKTYGQVRSASAYSVRKAEVYQDVRIKLEEYRKALKGLQHIKDISQPASDSEVQQYQQWLDARVSPTSRLSHLVKDDLRTFKVDKPPKSSNEYQQCIIYSAVVNILIPLTIFKFISNSLSRLIMLVIIIVIGAQQKDRFVMQIADDRASYTTAFIGVSVFTAIFL